MRTSPAIRASWGATRKRRCTCANSKRTRRSILPLIAKNGGSIINIAGDGIVAQFQGAVRAVGCAVAIQKIMAERNFDVPRRAANAAAHRRQSHGDIIHDGTRTFGDGINVAARLEPLAEPGGICISANVRDAVFGKLGLPCATSGEKAAQEHRPADSHLSDPVAGTRTRHHWLSAGLRQYRRVAPPLHWSFSPRSRHRCVALLAARDAGVRRPADRRGAAVQYRWKRSREKRFRAKPHERGVGLSLDISGRAHPRGCGTSVQAQPWRGGAASRASYALDGDVAKADGKTRIRARLTDVATGQTLWSDQYDFEGSGRRNAEYAAGKIYSPRRWLRQDIKSRNGEGVAQTGS